MAFGKGHYTASRSLSRADEGMQSAAERKSALRGPADLADLIGHGGKNFANQSARAGPVCQCSQVASNLNATKAFNDGAWIPMSDVGFKF